MPGRREGAALSINLVSSPLGHENIYFKFKFTTSMSWGVGCLLVIFLKKSCLVLKLIVFRGMVKVFLLISSYSNINREDQLR